MITPILAPVSGKMTVQRGVMGEGMANEGKRNANLKHIIYKIKCKSHHWSRHAGENI
jgi:hypothetical protein